MIRDATDDDLPRLVELGTRFATETVYRDRLPLNAAAMARTIALLIDHDQGAVFVAEAADGHVVGAIGVMGFENPLTGEPSVSEVFWYVAPEHRGHGLRLLTRAETWARDRGAQKLHMVAPTPEVSRLYERLGYAYLETTYQKALA